LTAALANQYHVERELGAGGMATVYLAHDLRHNRQVALKVLKPELAAILGAQRFLKEIQVTANLQHPHILPLYDSGSADGVLFYVMPLVQGNHFASGSSQKRFCQSTKRSGSRGRSPAHSTSRTGKAFSTATSSRRTSCCPTARRCSPTSVSPSR
jgi:serine/threonine protein kinase